MSKNIKIHKVDVPNFGSIKNVYNTLLSESIGSKYSKNKELFKDYVNALKENEILKTQFLVYNNIETKIESDSFKASLYLQENINLLNKFDKKSIKEANLKLATPILFEQIDLKISSLHKNIDTLIFTEKKAHNIDTIMEATNAILDYIKTNTKREVTEVIDLPMSMVESTMYKRFDEKYESMSEADKKLLKSLLECDDEQKKILYTDILKECLVMINENLKGSDLETKDRLLRVKEKLLDDKCAVNEDYVSNLSKLIELQGNLKS